MGPFSFPLVVLGDSAIAQPKIQTREVAVDGFLL